MPELAVDIATEVKQDRASLIPSPVGKPNGYVLTVTDTDGFAWRQPPEADILSGNGDPNGNLNAPKGSLYVERDAAPPVLWVNDDGLSSWTAVGPVAPAASTFPITEVGATNTHSITTGSTAITMETDDNTSGYEAKVVVNSTESLNQSYVVAEAATANHSGQFGLVITDTASSARGRLVDDGTTSDWFVYAGSPVGVKSASAAGSFCFDTSARQLWIAEAAGLFNWIPIDQKKYVANATATGTVTVNFLAARVHRLTLTGNITTLTLTAPITGWAAKLTLYLVQGGAGSFTVTWPASVKWPGGVAPTLSTAVGKVDKVQLETFDGGTNWYAELVGLAYA